MEFRNVVMITLYVRQQKRLFSSSSLSAIRVVSAAYLRLLIFLPAVLIPTCASSSPAFLMMYSAYKLNKQGDNIQPWRTPFPIWNQSEKYKSKLQWDITSHLSEWPSSKSLQTINAGEGVEKRECSCTVGGNVNWYSYYGRWYGDFLKN